MNSSNVVHFSFILIFCFSAQAIKGMNKDNSSEDKKNQLKKNTLVIKSVNAISDNGKFIVHMKSKKPVEKLIGVKFQIKDNFGIALVNTKTSEKITKIMVSIDNAFHGIKSTYLDNGGNTFVIMYEDDRVGKAIMIKSRKVYDCFGFSDKYFLSKRIDDNGLIVRPYDINKKSITIDYSNYESKAGIEIYAEASYFSYIQYKINNELQDRYNDVNKVYFINDNIMIMTHHECEYTDLVQYNADEGTMTGHLLPLKLSKFIEEELHYIIISADGREHRFDKN